MNGTELLKYMELIDEDILAKHMQPPKRKSVTRKKVTAIAACLALLLCAFILVYHSAAEHPVSNQIPTIEAAAGPERIYGAASFGQIGSLDQLASFEMAPPEFRFGCSGMVITAKVIEDLPDTYYLPSYSLEANPVPYRLLRLAVLSVVSGTGIPGEIWYLLPERLFVDMTGYDTLVISMAQVGYDSIVLQNITAGKMEAFDLVFSSGTQPELGDIIAFSEGVFDESLWQNESWYYGYQFGRSYLDRPESEYGNMVVSRGGTLEETLDRIRSKLDSDRYAEPAVERLEFQTEEAKQLLEHVRSFENGVYVQIPMGDSVSFYRYVSGCRTNESITIDLKTERITYSEAAFTREELASMPDVAGYLEQMQTEADSQIPQPPHMDAEGKTLRTYGAYGWYEKTEKGVYGIVKAVWTYLGRQEEEGRYTGYYDAQYILLDVQNGKIEAISTEELNALLGENRFSDEGYGKPFEVPFC